MAPKLGAKNSSEQSSDWFVAKDVAIVLGYTNSAKIKAGTVYAMNNHDRHRIRATREPGKAKSQATHAQSKSSAATSATSATQSANSRRSPVG